MKKYIVHFIIWGLGVISYYILEKTTAGDGIINRMFDVLCSVLYFYDIRNQEN